MYFELSKIGKAIDWQRLAPSRRKPEAQTVEFWKLCNLFEDVLERAFVIDGIATFQKTSDVYLISADQ